jgi:aldose 1-epimerase
MRAFARVLCASLWLGLVCAGETKMKLSSEPFGTSPDGKPITLFTLENSHGMRAKLMSWGANLFSLEVPDKAGKAIDVTLGFDKAEGYFKAYPYFGSTVGRYGNRIAKAQFTLDGKTYTLAKNNGDNTLHGGLVGFDKKLWTATPGTPDNDKASVNFKYTSPDGEEGYPGTLKVSVTYTLTEKNELRIDYEATTDKATVLNLTNHTYWNLAGAAAGSVFGHEMTLDADEYIPVDDGSIPDQGLKPVKGTPMDFTTPHLIGERCDQVGKKPTGYDHTWVIRGKAGALNHAATVVEPKSGRVMDVYTDQPGVQFYTGNYMDGTTIVRGNVACQKNQGFCLETQHYPDSPNQPAFPTTVLRPGETFKSSTVHVFSVK